MRAFLAVFLCSAAAAAEDAVLTAASVAETSQGSPHGIAIIDVNQDGKPDCVIDQIRPAGINIFLNDGKGNLKGDFNRMLGTRMGPNFGTGADVDGDGLRDFLQLDTNSGKLTVYKASKGRLSDGQETDLNIGWPISAYFFDMNGDRRPDVIVCGWPDPVVDKTPGRLKVLLGPSFKESASIDIPECGATVAGDVTGDKKPDVVTTDQKESVILVFAGDGRGLLNKQALKIPLDGNEKDLKPKGIAIADLDGDKILDLAVACEERTFVRIMKGDGKGGFTKKEDISLPSKARFTAVGDFNGDKFPDLAIGSSQLSMPWFVTILLGDGKGGWTKNCEFTGEGYFHFYSWAVGDMDGDKKDDLAITTIGKDEVTGQVRRFLSKK